jgi:hypothetical protein
VIHMGMIVGMRGDSIRMRLLKGQVSIAVCDDEKEASKRRSVRFVWGVRFGYFEREGIKIKRTGAHSPLEVLQSRDAHLRIRLVRVRLSLVDRLRPWQKRESMRSFERTERTMSRPARRNDQLHAPMRLRVGFLSRG